MFPLLKIYIVLMGFLYLTLMSDVILTHLCICRKKYVFSLFNPSSIAVPFLDDTVKNANNHFILLSVSLKRTQTETQYSKRADKERGCGSAAVKALAGFERDDAHVLLKSLLPLLRLNRKCHRVLNGSGLYNNPTRPPTRRPSPTDLGFAFGDIIDS